MSVTDKINIIDPHIHLFNLKQGQYHWLKAENPPYWSDKAIIAKPFNEQGLHLKPPLSLAGFVHIEAGFDNKQPWREIAWLEQHCRKPFRSIAFSDLLQPPKNFQTQVDKLLIFKSVIGIRHIFDDQALALLTHEYTVENLAYLASKQLIVEVQMPITALKAVDKLITLSHKLTLKIVINHAGFPPLLANHKCWQQWLQGLTLLSQQPRCYIKCSGWEMRSRHYSFIWINKVLANCIHYFGEQRVMLASNFPLCNFTQNYQQLWQSYRRLALNSQQLNLLTYKNAHTIYQIA